MFFVEEVIVNNVRIGDRRKERLWGDLHIQTFVISTIGLASKLWVFPCPTITTPPLAACILSKPSDNPGVWCFLFFRGGLRPDKTRQSR